MPDFIDADTDPDGVDAALGLGDPDGKPDDEQDPDTDADNGDDEGDGEDELTLADLAEQLAEQRRVIASLKRELAQRRVQSKAEPKGKATDQGDALTVEQAREQGREEARLEAGLELAGASIRAALVGIVPEGDLDDFVDDLRLDRYVGEDGKPDRDAIKALRDRQAKITRRKAPAKTGHGRQNGAPAAKSNGELFSDAMSAAGF